MHKLKTVRKLDLSYNELDRMPRDQDYFAKMESLEFLVLSQNNIATVEAISSLKSAPNLKYLALEDNPISEINMYRYDMASLLPKLLGLD